MKWMERCLSSLRHSTVPTTIVVIDNLSTDGTVDFIKKNFPEVVCLPQSKNLGFGQANNLGMRYALENDANYVLLLNQDAYLAPDAFEQMLDESDGKSLLSPIHMNGTDDAIDFNFKQNTLTNTRVNLIDDLLCGTVKGKYKVDYVNAACWFMPISIIKRIGGFNPLFKQYSEDDNYVHRLSYFGIDIYVVPKARVCHDRNRVGNVTVYKKGKVKRELFSEACNIDHTLPQRIKKYLKILNDQRDNPLECITAILWLPTQVAKAYRSRTVERKNIPHWL